MGVALNCGICGDVDTFQRDLNSGNIFLVPRVAASLRHSEFVLVVLGVFYFNLNVFSYLILGQRIGHSRVYTVTCWTRDMSSKTL